MTHRLLVALLTVAVVGSAHAGKAHVHGAGTIDISIDRDQLVISLELPLDAAVGFERAPKTAAEKAALDGAAKVLNDAAALFLPAAAANCSLQSVDVQVPFRAAAPKAAKPSRAEHGDEGHADIDARYVFRCANPAALKSVETRLFGHFKRLYRLEVQRAGPGGQAAGRLTPKQPGLSW
ncbi:MAG: DUF2796 domain-containing protein [Rhodocyclales bacterium]|nr:DUF2796 domain-containing protein [Rhodocyclales bacterium]